MNECADATEPVVQAPRGPISVNNQRTNEHDIDGDGKIDIYEKQLVLIRWETKIRILWLSIWFIGIISVIAVAVAFSSHISIEKYKVLTDFLNWVFFGCFSIIGGFMGVSVWAMKK